MFGSAIFYPAMLGNEEDNKIKISLHNPMMSILAHRRATRG
jgi:hypothetical protein